MAVIPPAVECTSQGHIVTFKITVFDSQGDWVEHNAQVNMQGAEGLSVDDIGARYIAPALNAIAHRIVAHREPVV